MVTRTSVLGGESKNRGLISGRKSRGATVTWIVTAVVCCLLLLFLQFRGLILAVIVAGAVLVALMDIGTGSTPWSRRQDRRRMRYRRRTGIVDFVPVDDRPDDLPPKDPTWIRYRDWPDGVDGLSWLRSAPGVPAVAYHTPVGQDPYLSVTFGVDGPVQGLHGDAYVARAQEAFGELMAGWGSGQKLVSGIQIVTRVLPADSAAHESWLMEQLDRDGAPIALQDDYLDLSDELTALSFVQRHFVVIRWNVDAGWHRVADRQGAGLAGWLDIITAALASVERRLQDAMYVKVRPLSGPRLGAVLRNMQHPGWPIDRASDVNVLPTDGLAGLAAVPRRMVVDGGQVGGPRPVPAGCPVAGVVLVAPDRAGPGGRTGGPGTRRHVALAAADGVGGADHPHPGRARAVHPGKGGEGHRPPGRHP